MDIIFVDFFYDTVWETVFSEENKVGHHTTWSEIPYAGREKKKVTQNPWGE